MMATVSTDQIVMMLEAVSLVRIMIWETEMKTKAVTIPPMLCAVECSSISRRFASDTTSMTAPISTIA